MKMKEMCAEERPREKMLAKGAGAMSNAELLAILIGSGTRNGNVLEVANRMLLKAGGRLSGIAGMSHEDMQQLEGIGTGRYSVIAAAFELGRRCALEDPGIEKVPVVDASIVYRMMIPRMKGLLHEELWAVFLNRANYVLKKEMLTKGGLTATVMDQKMIVKKALDLHASSVILVHNHPSGDPRPGSADMSQTRLVRKACQSMDILLLDHVIVCDDSFYSFADERVVTA